MVIVSIFEMFLKQLLYLIRNRPRASNEQGPNTHVLCCAMLWFGLLVRQVNLELVVFSRCPFSHIKVH